MKKFNYQELVDSKQALQKRSIFWDPAIYEEELKQIFNRCWLFLGHESQLPQTGDFIRTHIDNGAITACHDVADGGIAVAVAEMALAGNIGAMIQAHEPDAPFADARAFYRAHGFQAAGNVRNYLPCGGDMVVFLKDLTSHV